MGNENSTCCGQNNTYEHDAVPTNKYQFNSYSMEKRGANNQQRNYSTNSYNIQEGNRPG